MEPALDVINRALLGDAGARSFLDRTMSIYVLDLTDTSKPKTYGCWNFIHQAMNEVERYESRYGFTQSQQGPGLLGHVRLLATMALGVARRSPSTDKALVTTCISNASEYHGTASQSQWLIDVNVELREIVMGRIAAMALDFSFHRRTGQGPHGHSAFADRTVMDTFCAILSANAVSSGPKAIQLFAPEWIIPSSQNLPSFAVASVVLHLASEGMRKSAPAGTKDMLQQLSVSVVSIVLVPLLSDAVTENFCNLDGSASSREESSQMAAMCLRAIKTWCGATELSLPQIKHICSRVNVNIVGVLSDAMYSDSQNVIDSLADLIESAVHIAEDKIMSEGRMNQVRYIMQVDESAFQAQVSPDQLKTIEAKEMESIVDELVSAIALQRLRFGQRQSSGDHDACRSLTRIGASVCVAWLDCPGQTPFRQPERAIVNFLLKAAAHPFINVCGIALPILTRLVPRVHSFGDELLPILQRRAITPHQKNSGSVTLAISLCGASFLEFQIFRENILADALVACWRADGDAYVNSCTSAVEEFCSNRSSVDVSLQLEAALFCIETLVKDIFTSHRFLFFPHTEQMELITEALSVKPARWMRNPLARLRMCRLLRKYSRWYMERDDLDVVTNLAMPAFSESIEPRPEEEELRSMMRESSLSDVSEATATLKELFCQTPKHFTGDANIAFLGAGWAASYSVADRKGVIAIDDRLNLCIGICHVLACLPETQRMKSFEAMMAPSLGRLGTKSLEAQGSKDSSRLATALSQISDEIRIQSMMSRTFANAGSSETDAMESGCDTSPDRHAPIPEPILAIFRRGWPTIVHTATNYSGDENVAIAMDALLSELLPSAYEDAGSLTLLQDLFSLASAILSTTSTSLGRFDAIYNFLGQVIQTYGAGIEKVALALLGGSSIDQNEREVGRLTEELLLNTIWAVRESLGSAWTSPNQQRQGQPAFESKPSPKKEPPQTTTTTNKSLGKMLKLLTKCLETCPVFLLYLPAGPGIDRDDDMLLRRAIDSAAASLNDLDAETAANAIKFLDAVTKQEASSNASVSSVISDAIARIRADVINSLLAGCCGQYESSVVADVANLLSAFVSSGPAAEIESYVVASLKQDYFQLGDPAKNITLAILARSCQKQLSPTDLAVFLEDVRQLHEIEGKNELPTSDSVAQFIRKYG